MSAYAAQYLNLLNQLADQQSQRLRDVASARAAAQMASAQAWGNLPLQLTAIGNQAFDNYQGQKRLDLQDQRQRELDEYRDATLSMQAERAAREAEAERNAANNQRMLGELESVYGDSNPSEVVRQGNLVDPKWAQDYAKTTRSSITEKDVDRLMWSVAPKLQEAAESDEGYARNIGAITETFNRLNFATQGAFPSGEAMPQVRTPEAARGLTEAASHILRADDATAKPVEGVDPATGQPATLFVTQMGRTIRAIPKAPKTPSVGSDEWLLDASPEKLRELGRRKDIVNPPRAAASGGGAAQSSDPGTVVYTPPDATESREFIKGGTATKKTIWEAAESWVFEGKMPYNSRSADPRQRANFDAVLNTGSAMVPNEASLPQLRSEYSSLNGAQKMQTKQYVATKAYVESMLMGLDRAKELSSTYKRGSVPKANEWQRWWKRNVSGDPALTEFEVFVFNTVRDYGKATSGSAQSIQQMTDAQIKAAETLMNSAQTPAQFEAAAKSITQDALNILSRQRASIQGIKDSLVSALDSSFGVPPYLAAPQANTQGPFYGKATDGSGKIIRYESQAARDVDVRKGWVAPTAAPAGQTNKFGLQKPR